VTADPNCCVGEKIRVSLEGFDRGALTTYRSLWHVVKRLSREEALELIEEQIVALERAQNRRET
jgi:hypothetical protein